MAQSSVHPNIAPYNLANKAEDLSSSTMKSKAIHSRPMDRNLKGTSTKRQKLQSHGFSSSINKIKIHQISSLKEVEKSWDKGYGLWKDIYENGFALLQVDFSPVQYRHLEGRIGNDAAYEPDIGYQKADGRAAYVHHQGTACPSSISNNPELNDVLNMSFEKLQAAAAHVFKELYGKNAASYSQEYLKEIDAAFQTTQSKIITAAADLNSKTSSRGRILSSLYKDLEQLRQKQKPLNDFSGLAHFNGAEEQKLLSNYPVAPGKVSPDFLSVEKYTGGGLDEHTDRGLLSLVFRDRPNPLIPGGLEIFTKEGVWYEVEKDICNRGNICVVFPGHQMELLTKGAFKATRHRVRKCFGTSTGFGLSAIEEAVINGRSVSKINAKWDASLRSKRLVKAAVEAAPASSVPRPQPPRTLPTFIYPSMSTDSKSQPSAGSLGLGLLPGGATGSGPRAGPGAKASYAIKREVAPPAPAPPRTARRGSAPALPPSLADFSLSLDSPELISDIIVGHHASLEDYWDSRDVPLSPTAAGGHLSYLSSSDEGYGPLGGGDASPGGCSSEFLTSPELDDDTMEFGYGGGGSALGDEEDFLFFDPGLVAEGGDLAALDADHLFDAKFEAAISS